LISDEMPISQHLEGAGCRIGSGKMKLRYASLDRLHGLKTEPMARIIVAISASYPRIFLSIVDSPACPAVHHGQTRPAQMDNLLPAELSAVLKIFLH